MLNKITSQWKLASPKTKKTIIIGGGLVAAISLIALFGTDSEAEKTQKRIKKYETTSNVLTDSNTREAGIDEVTRRIRKIESESKEVAKRFDNIAKDLARQQEESLKKDEKIKNELIAEVQKLKSDLEVMVEEKQAQARQSEMKSEDNAAAKPTQREKNIDDFYSSTPEEKQAAATPGKIREIMDEALAEKKQKEKSAKDAPFKLPAGSMLSGILITGMEAGAGKNAKRNATPALMRVSKEAVLPNRYTADVKECFVTLSGYGELASERVMMRSEYISCVKDDGTAIEAKLNAFTTGEDGKSGVRGRLITRNGQMIANAMMSGFLSGFADFATVRPVTSFGNFQGADRYAAQMESLVSTAGIGGVAMRGTSKAMDKIADYYMQMADQSFPIVSVEAGREITLIVQNGAAMTSQNQQDSYMNQQGNYPQNNRGYPQNNRSNNGFNDGRNQQQTFQLGGAFDVDRMDEEY